MPQLAHQSPNFDRPVVDRHSCCAGFSLLEVILALAIFGVAMAMLGNILSNGARAAVESRDLARAQILCESKMAEVLLNPAGPQALADVDLVTNDTLRQWQYTVQSQPAPVNGMLAVQVSVKMIASDPSVFPVEFSLVRWIVDPALELQAKEDEQSAQEQSDDASAL